MSPKVQHPLPTIGLELYQLWVHIRAKNMSRYFVADQVFFNVLVAWLRWSNCVTQLNITARWMWPCFTAKKSFMTLSPRREGQINNSSNKSIFSLKVDFWFLIAIDNLVSAKNYSFNVVIAAEHCRRQRRLGNKKLVILFYIYHK